MVQANRIRKLAPRPRFESRQTPLKAAQFAVSSSDTYTRRTPKGKIAIVRKGKRKLLRPALIGLAGASLVGAGLLLAARKPRLKALSQKLRVAEQIDQARSSVAIDPVPVALAVDDAPVLTKRRGRPPKQALR